MSSFHDVMYAIYYTLSSIIYIQCPDARFELMPEAARNLIIDKSRLHQQLSIIPNAWLHSFPVSWQELFALL